LIAFLNNIGVLPEDPPGLRLQKRFLVYLGLSMSMGGILWGSLCGAFGLWLPASIPYGYVLLTAINLSLFAITRNFSIARFFQVLVSLLLPFLFQFSLGTFASTGGIMLWALISLVGAFTFEKLGNTLYWLALYIVLTVMLGVYEKHSLALLQVSPQMSTLFFVLNIAIISTIVSGLSYYFLKSRGSIMDELAAAKRETDVVMHSVEEGLFLITFGTNEFFIGVQQSAAVNKILEIEDLPAIDFAAALSPFVTPAKLLEVRNYLKLLASKNAKPDMVAMLNPLDSVPVAVGNPPKLKNLRFGFSRVTSENLLQYLVRISDITESVRLQEQLEENQRKNKESTDMILSVLHVGPGLLEDFIDGVDAELAVIENILQNDNTSEQVVARLEELYRSVHSIKGNASLLDLSILTGVAHDFEEKIMAIRGREKVDWDEFLPLAIDLSKLQATNASLKELLTRLQNFRQETGDVTQSAIAAIPQSVKSMVARLAPEYGKNIEVEFGQFDGAGVPNKFAYIVRDIAVQLARNSVAHGIEKAEIREAAGKNTAGKIILELSVNPKEFTLTVRDDGASFNFDRIKRLAMERTRATEAEASAWSQKRLIQFLFEPGFSTAEETTMTAGRGMGMDIVKQRIKNAGGELKINFAPGKYTEFKMVIPLNSDAEIQ
jgi:two-component system, chemotaxis family, sensor kinase CheA